MLPRPCMFAGSAYSAPLRVPLSHGSHVHSEPCGALALPHRYKDGSDDKGPGYNQVKVSSQAGSLIFTQPVSLLASPNMYFLPVCTRSSFGTFGVGLCVCFLCVFVLVAVPLQQAGLFVFLLGFPMLARPAVPCHGIFIGIPCRRLPSLAPRVSRSPLQPGPAPAGKDQQVGETPAFMSMFQFNDNGSIKW